FLTLVGLRLRAHLVAAQMQIAVVGDLMARLQQLLDQSGVVLGGVAGDEEGARNVLAGKQIQDARDAASDTVATLRQDCEAAGVLLAFTEPACFGVDVEGEGDGGGFSVREGGHRSSCALRGFYEL